MSGHPQTIITTTTLTDTVTTTSIYVPVTTETVTTTEIKIPTVTTTETELSELQEIIKTKLETWIEEHVTPTTTITEQWIPVDTTTTIETHTETETAVTYSTAVFVEKTFTYTQLVWTETDAKTVTTASQAIMTETVIPADGTTTITEVYTIAETTGTTQTSIYTTTLTGVRTAATVVTVPAEIPAHVGWFPAGTVIRLTGVDDYAELWVNGSCVATALSNGKPASAGFIAGSASYTIPQDGYYTISICNHDNRFGGPTYEGSLDLGGVPVVDTSQPGFTTTTTAIVVDPGTITKIPVDWTVTDYLTLTGTTILTETFVPAGDETTTTEIQTITVITFEVDTKTQTQIVTEVEGSVSYQTITISTYTGMTLTDTVTTTRTLGGWRTQIVIPTNTVTTQLVSTIKTWIEYVPVTYETVTTTKTLTTTETTLTLPLITQTKVNIYVPATTVTTITRLVDLDCLGGAYYGFVPVDDIYRDGNVIEHIRQGTDEHCIIR